MHERSMYLFKEYMLVGGMSQAVVAFAENGRDFALADIEKRDILSFYRDDIKNDLVVKCYMRDIGLLVSLVFNENKIADQQLYMLMMNDNSKR